MIDLKKLLPSLFSALLLVISIQPAALAETTSRTESEIKTKVDRLSLEKVIKLAVEDNHKLTLLTLKQGVLRNTIEDLDEDWDDARGSRRNQLDVAIEKVRTEQKKSVLQRQEAEETIILQKTGEYTNLLSNIEQINLTKRFLNVLEKDLNAAKINKVLGTATNKQIRELAQEIEYKKKDLEVLENNYQLALSQLSYDLNLDFSADLVFEDIEMKTINRVERSNNLNEIIANSFEMERAKEDLLYDKWELDQDYTDNEYEESILLENVLIGEETIDQLQTELMKKADQIYVEVENAYKNYQTELLNLTQAKQDYKEIEAKFQLGLVSKHEFEKAYLALQNAETKVQLTKLTYFVKKEKIKAMNRGFIQ